MQRKWNHCKMHNAGRLGVHGRVTAEGTSELFSIKRFRARCIRVSECYVMEEDLMNI